MVPHVIPAKRTEPKAVRSQAGWKRKWISFSPGLALSFLTRWFLSPPGFRLHFATQRYAAACLTLPRSLDASGVRRLARSSPSCSSSVKAGMKRSSSPCCARRHPRSRQQSAHRVRRGPWWRSSRCSSRARRSPRRGSTQRGRSSGWPSRTTVLPWVCSRSPCCRHRGARPRARARCAGCARARRQVEGLEHGPAHSSPASAWAPSRHCGAANELT